MRKIIYIVAVVCFFTFNVLAESSAKPAANKAKNEIEAKKETSLPTEATVESAKEDETSEPRAGKNWGLLFNYSPIDLIIPGKYGLTFGMFSDSNRLWEFEYLRGSLSVPFIIEDLGEMTDQRISLIRRKFYGKSFNIGYGLSYFTFKLHLGNELLNRLSAGTYPSIDVIDVQALGLNFSIGNRWLFGKNFTLGFDWFSIAQPIHLTKKDDSFLDHVTDATDRENVDEATRVISYFPRLTALKFQLGFLF